MEPRISLALLACGRPAALRRVLESVRAQSAPPWEMVVSDDSPDPNDVRENQAAAARAGARWLAGPRRGLYANRNAAARACRGTHVRAMDDDHLLPPGHLAACLDAVRRDPRALWTTGENGYVNGRFHEEAPLASELGPAGVGEPVPPSRADDNWAVADGSTTYPREVWDLPGGGFVEEWSYGSSYLEFGAWLYARGWRSRCVPGAMVEHHMDTAALARTGSFGEVQSQIFAILCWHFGFRRAPAGAVPRVLAALRGVPGRTRQLIALPRLFHLARARWRRESEK